MNPYIGENPRTKELLGKSNFLADKKITIVGLGGGGEIALHLLRSGITKFDLYDHDKLEASNLVRHICGIEHVGKNKAKAVRELLKRYIGKTRNKINAFDINIFNSLLKFEESLKTSDLIIIATDNDASKYLINELAVKHLKPAITVGMYENGEGGEVFAYIPGQSCIECLSHTTERSEYTKKYLESKKKKDCTSKRDTAAMPGLGVDQSFLAAIAARKCLDILLLENSESKLKQIGKNLIIWSLTGIDGLTDNTLHSIQFNFPIHPKCRLHL